MAGNSRWEVDDDRYDVITDEDSISDYESSNEDGSEFVYTDPEDTGNPIDLSGVDPSYFSNDSDEPDIPDPEPMEVPPIEDLQPEIPPVKDSEPENPEEPEFKKYTIDEDLKDNVPGLEGALLGREMSENDKALYTAVQIAIFNSLSDVSKGKIVDKLNEISKYTKDPATAVAKIIGSDMMHDKNIRRLTNKYLEEHEILTDEKALIRIDLASYTKDRNNNPVNDAVLRTKIGLKNRQSKEDPQTELRRIYIFSDQERTEWAYLITKAAELLYNDEMEPGKRAKAVFKENGISTDIYERAAYTKESLRKEKESQQKESKIDTDKFLSEEERTKFDKFMEEAGDETQKKRSISFRIIDHTGAHQSVHAYYTPGSDTIGLGVMALDPKSKNTDYALVFSDSVTPIYTTGKLFSPIEAAVLTNKAKEKIAGEVAKNTAEAINRYYSSDSTNKIGEISAVRTARDYKAAEIEKLLPTGSENRETAEKMIQNNRRLAKEVMEALGIRTRSDDWKPSITMVSTSAKDPTIDKTAVLRLENVGKAGDKTLSEIAGQLGLKYSYDNTNGVFSIWKQDTLMPPKLDNWQSVSIPNEREFNDALLKFTDIRVTADREGRSVDATKNHCTIDETMVWAKTRTALVKEPNTEKPALDAKLNQEIAREYLKAFGLNLGRFTRGDDYPFKSLNRNPMQIFEAPVIGKEDTTIPFVMIGAISENEYNNSKDMMKLMGLSVSYDKSTEVLYVARGDLGRPSFERESAYQVTDYTKLYENFKDAAAHTIGKVEAKHVYEDGSLGNTEIKNSILKGYKELTKTLEVKVNDRDPKEVKRESREIGRKAETHIYTPDFEELVREVRKDVLKDRTDLSKEARLCMER